MRTQARVTTVAGAATLLCAASTFGVGFSALAAPSAATTVQASAPSPMLVGGCGDTVRGAPGQRVGVRLASLPVVDVGEVPSSGSAMFDAAPALREMVGPTAPTCKITAEATPPLIAPLGTVIDPVLAPAKGAVGTIPALNQPSSPGAPAAPPPAAPAEQPQPAAAPAALTPASYGGPFYGPMSPSFPYALGLYNSGLPRFNYADLLMIGSPSAGSLGRLSAGMLTADLFGTTAVSNSPVLGKQSAAANDVAAAGRATALPTSGVERIALPVLVAVLMLATVSAALLRSWVLGRR
jgi:hypothetical protein